MRQRIGFTHGRMKPMTPDKPIRYVTVLHQHPIKSAHDAVKIAIEQEIRSLGTNEA
jgi:hypothetical protein